jgi:hypothetical protein
MEHMDSTPELQELEASLLRLVSILRLDGACRWTSHFETSLATTRRLLNDGYSPADLNELSASITRLYAGQASFNDYFPHHDDDATGRISPIRGTERFDDASTDVQTRAVGIRSTGDLL